MFINKTVKTFIARCVTVKVVYNVQLLFIASIWGSKRNTLHVIKARRIGKCHEGCLLYNVATHIK